MTIALSSSSSISLSTSTTVVVGFVSFYVISSVISWYRLRQFRGPLVATFSYLWLAKSTWSGYEHETYTKLHDQFRPLIRIGPSDLATSSPDLICRMSEVRDSYSKSDWYMAMRFTPNNETLGSLVDRELHDKKRAQLAPGYFLRDNPQFEQEIDDVLLAFVNMIRTHYISDEKKMRPLELGSVAQYFTMDVITRVGWGKELGFLKTNSDLHSFIYELEKHIRVMMVCGNIPMLRRIVFSSWGLGSIGPSLKDAKGLGMIMK